MDSGSTSKPSIVAVLESYEFVGLQDYGGWRPTRCVFHGDRHASASYNADEGAFVCHTCDIKGDAYAVVMQHEGIGFPEAKTRVTEITGREYDANHTSTGTAYGGRSKLPAWTAGRGSRKRAFH